VCRSFLRQLNQYSFKKADPDAWTYTHPSGCFKAGHENQLWRIRRRPSGKQGASTVPPQPPAVEFSSYSPIQGAVDSTGSTMEAQLKQLMRDHSVVVTELIRVRKQQEEQKQKQAKLLKVVHNLVTLSTNNQIRQTAVEQRLQECIQAVREFFAHAGHTGQGQTPTPFEINGAQPLLTLTNGAVASGVGNDLGGSELFGGGVKRPRAFSRDSYGYSPAADTQAHSLAVSAAVVDGAGGLFDSVPTDPGAEQTSTAIDSILLPPSPQISANSPLLIPALELPRMASADLPSQTELLAQSAKIQRCSNEMVNLHGV
jgi:hypothetical protein